MTASNKEIKIVKFLEKMWLVIGFTCIFISIYKFFTASTYDVLYFLCFSGVAFVLFYLRRRYRRNLEKKTLKTKN